MLLINIVTFELSVNIKIHFLSLNPIFRWTDPLTEIQHDIRVALQVRIRPDTYDVGKQTIGARGTIDPLFPNSELEWSTDRRGVVILVGLLVKVEDVVGDVTSKMKDLSVTPDVQKGMKIDPVLIINFTPYSNKSPA